MNDNPMTPDPGTTDPQVYRFAPGGNWTEEDLKRLAEAQERWEQFAAAAQGDAE